MRFASKEFLSPAADEAGNIICKIKTTLVKDMSHYTVDQGGVMYSSVRIADCSDHVILDFDCTGDKGFEKRLTKLDKLISELQNMRGQYVEMWHSHKRDIEFYKRKEGIKDEA